jgi:hypothetical protein
VANLVVIDGGATTRELKAEGTGTTGDPLIPHHVLDRVTGPANVAVSQVTATTTAATLAGARATRCSLVIKNTDAAITVYVGPATVTSGNGMPVKAGESLAVSWVGLVQVISASGSPVVAIWDEY